MAASLPQLATALIGCGPGAGVQLCAGGGCCNIVEFGNCTVGSMMLTLSQAAQCESSTNSGMSLTADGPAGIMEVCAAPVSATTWFGWLTSTQEGTQVGMSATCQTSALLCATTQICNSNHGCCTVPGYGSCTVIDFTPYTLSFGPEDMCTYFGASGAALSTTNEYNNSTACALPAGINTWTAWWSLPTISWHDTMNATCV